MKGKILVQRLALLMCLMMLSAPTVLAGPMEGVYCKGDFNYDGNVGSDDVQEFIAHTGRNQYNDPCPSDGGPGGKARPSHVVPGRRRGGLSDCGKRLRACASP